MANKLTATIPAKITFEDTELTVIDRDGTPWLTGHQIGDALAMANRQSANNLFNSHKDEFTKAMTTVIKQGRTRVRIFSPRGCHLIAMFARTPKAKAFRKWVLDVLEGLQDTPLPAHKVSTGLPYLPPRTVAFCDRQAALEHLIRRLRDHHPTVTVYQAQEREEIADELERLSPEKGDAPLAPQLKKRGIHE